jgi:hypothetical protein
MQYEYDSKAERTAAPILAALGVKRCTSFPSGSYRDSAGVSLEGKPDGVVHLPHGPVYIELKHGALNNHYTRESSREALANEYMWLFHKPADSLSYSALSKALCDAPSKTGELAIKDHAWNHSLWKVLALQAQFGWRHYIVCFKQNPKPIDAERYCAAGLVWCTLKTLPQLLIRLELEALGISGSFVHRATKFEYQVEFDDGSATASETRNHFLATVQADRAAKATQRAREAANLAAGILPF